MPTTVPVPPAGFDPDGLARLLRAVGAAEGESRYVGGWVRDSLLGQPAADVDIATRLPPEETVRRLEAAGVELWTSRSGLLHGTVGAVVGGKPLEITTLRRDVETDGRRATVAFSAHWREDAARRDFTINALFADPLTGEVHDFHHGLADLAERRVRFIGDPLTRIAEDHLRILRFFRFQARFGGAEPDRAALDACAARANDLMALSRERIADELLKLLAMPRPAATLALMVGQGILRPVLPEIGDDGVVRLRALEERESRHEGAPDPLRRLAALLGPEGGLGEAVAARLKLSNAARARLAATTAPGWRAEEPRALAYRLGTDAARDRLLLLSPDPGPALRALDGWEKPKLPLTGGALIARGLKPGPKVAATLQAIERDWISAGFPESDALEALVSARLAEALA